MNNYEDILGDLYYELESLSLDEAENSKITYNLSVKRNQTNGRMLELESIKANLLEQNAFIISHKKNKLILLLFNKSIRDLERIEKKIESIENEIKTCKADIETYEKTISDLEQARTNILKAMTKILNNIRSNDKIMYQIFQQQFEKIDNVELFKMIFGSTQVQKTKKK